MRTKKLLHKLLKLLGLIWDNLSDTTLFQFMKLAVVVSVIAFVYSCGVRVVFSLLSRIFWF